jgi:hypothetical protein
MSFTHGKGTRTFINTTECSAFLNSVEQSISREMSETSVFGSAVKTYTKGLRDSTITLSGYWDGATDAIDAVMNRLFENVNLLPAGDAVANYTNVSNVTNAVTPISGFAASIYFQDNSVTRTIEKSPSEIVANAVYQLYGTVQMDDDSAPVHYTFGGSNGDFHARPLLSAQISLISGSIYRFLNSFTPINGNIAQTNVTQVYKTAAFSAKGFRLAGLTLEATNLTNAISILDEGNTLGAKALVASAKATSYQVTNAVGDTVGVSAEFQVDGSGNAANSVTEQNLFSGSNDIPQTSYGTIGAVTNVPGGVSGFTNSIGFADNSQTRIAVRSFSIPSGTYVTFSCYVQMDDGSAPVVGTGTDATADIRLFLNYGSVGSTLTNCAVRNVYGSTYLVSLSARTTGSDPNHGLAKYTTNSAKGFKTTAWSIFIPRLPTGAFRGQVLAPLAVRGNNSTSTALDNGVGTSNGMVFNIHMLNNAATTRVTIQHSPDGSTWSDFVASYQTASIKFAQSGATVGPVNRYLRTLVTTSGSPQILVTAARR